MELSTKFSKRQVDGKFYKHVSAFLFIYQVLIWVSGFVDSNHVVIGVHENLKEQLRQLSDMV